MEWSDGKVFRYEYIGADNGGNYQFKMTRTNGGPSGKFRTLRFTPDMAYVGNEIATNTPHAGRKPVLDVGDKWQVNYAYSDRKTDHRRLETCASDQRELRKFSNIQFDAIKVVCTVERQDNNNSWTTISWFDTKTGFEIDHEQKWDGGGKWSRLKEVELQPR